MKNLKTFNIYFESSEPLSISFTEELRDFCETNLAYLLDEGTEIEVGETQNGNFVKIRFTPNGVSSMNMKSWDDIKDHIIPFATRLNNKYEMECNPILDYDNVRIWTYRKNVVPGMGSMTRKIEDLINDDVWGDILIRDIDIYIKGYKKEPKKGILTKIKSFFK